MLVHIVLAALQFAAAFFGAPSVIQVLRLSFGGDAQNFIQAAVSAVIVWIVGVVASLPMQDVRMPTSSTLVSTLFGALFGAALTLAAVRQYIPFNAPPPVLWIAGAIIGYMVRR